MILILNKVRKDLINKYMNLTINNAINYSNRSNASDMSDVQFQFAGNSAGFSHQNLLRERIIGIRHKEVPVLVPPTEPIIILNNQTDRILSTGVIQAPQLFKTPVMQELVRVMTPCNR